MHLRFRSVASLLALVAAPAGAQVIPHVYAGIEAGPGSRAGIDADDGHHDRHGDLAGGLFAGIELPAGGLPYVAVEAELGDATGHTDTLAVLGGAVRSAHADPRWNWAANARLGLRPLPGLAAYGIAGYGGERVRVVATDGSDLRDSGWLHGINYGLGARYALGFTAVRLEYRRQATGGRYDPGALLGGIAFRF